MLNPNIPINLNIRKRWIPVTLVALANLLSACQEKPASNAQSQPQQVEPASVAPTVFAAKIIPGDAPDAYRVQLAWPLGIHPDSWALSRTDSKGNVTSVPEVSGDKNQTTDPNVVPGETYRYGLFSVQESQQVLRESTTISIPKDLEVRANHILLASEMKALTPQSRLFLRNKAHLIFDGNDAEMTFADLISEDGTIESFAETKTSPAGPGRSAGNVKIRVQKGSGVLHLVARGEKGGAGPIGFPGTAGHTGAKGENATLQYTGHMSGFHGMDGSAVVRAMRSMASFNPSQFRCSGQTGDGYPGTAGTGGTPGGTGYPGGDSGRWHFELVEVPGLSVLPEALVGMGGDGGAGGAGGAGGPGGPPGDRDELQLARVANAGPVGPSGPAGPAGPVGTSGKLRLICVRLGASSSGDCTGF